MDAGDRKLFEESIRRATERHTAAALDAALADLGWLDAASQDRREAVSIVFEAQGTAGVTSSAIDDVLAMSLGVDPARTAVLLPCIGQWQPGAKIEGEHLLVRGLATGALNRRAHVAVVTSQGRYKPLVFVVARSDLQACPAPGLDPDLGLIEVAAQLPLPDRRTPADWPAVAASGQVALAHELVGACQTMLRLAREHAVERVQFDRPIASFQAIRHRLAESLVAIEAAQACIASAWDAATPLSAILAKSIAGSSARTVARHAQQVLGGMGYTTEHPLHRYVRRVLVLDQLLGAGRTLTREIGEQLLRECELPEILPL